MNVCPKCKTEIEQGIANGGDGSRPCWACLAHEGEMIVRRVELETQTGFEIHFVVTTSNIEAIREVYRLGVTAVSCVPCG